MTDRRWLVTALLLGATACHEPGLVTPREAAPYTAPAYRQNPPVDVAVLLPPAAAGVDAAAQRTLRERAYAELMRKGYSPLALSYVDAMAGTADPAAAGDVDLDALRDRIRADAFLQLRVQRVDVVAGGRRRVGAVASLRDGESGAILFENEVVDQDMLRAGPAPSEEQWGRLAQRLLAPLPARE